MNRYTVTYYELSTGKLKMGIYEAISLTHLVYVLEYALGYVPEVISVVRR
jgi:hypothetical protein